MTEHPGNSLHNVIEDNRIKKLSGTESNTRVPSGLSLIAGKLWYWWSLAMAAMLLLVLGPIVLPAAWVAGRPYWVYPSARFGARNWLRLSGVKVRVCGREHLDPDQTYVFVSNHRSYLDTATLFYYPKPRMGVLAKKELLKVPILGWGMENVNIKAIDRSNRERAAKTLRAAVDCLRSGISFGVFAEGTRARPGQLLPFKKGPFYMAIEAGVPIVPVAIKNSDVLMGKGTGIARPGILEMVFLSPIETRGLSTEDDVKRLAEVTQRQVAEELGKQMAVKS